MKNFTTKSLILFVVLLVVSLVGKAQTTLITDPSKASKGKYKVHTGNNNKIVCSYTNKQRYKIDYEIKNVANPTDDQINGIDLLKLENHRDADASVEVNDAATGQTIILYSITESIKRELESKYFIDFIRTLYVIEN